MFLLAIFAPLETKETALDFETSIGLWIGLTTKIVDYHLADAMHCHGIDLSKEQMIILKKLYEQDGLNQNELANLTFRDKSSLARLLSKMERKKYIFREQSSDDKRANEVFLTPQGRLVYQKTRPIIKEMIDRMERDVSDKDKQKVIEILKKVQRNFLIQHEPA